MWKNYMLAALNVAVAGLPFLVGSYINIPIISLNKVFPEAFTVSDLATLRALSSIFSIRNAPF